MNAPNQLAPQADNSVAVRGRNMAAALSSYARQLTFAHAQAELLGEKIEPVSRQKFKHAFGGGKGNVCGLRGA